MVMKTALITGGAKRIGEAITRALAARGYAVAIHYQSSADHAQGLADEINKEGGNAIALGADISAADAPQALIDQVTSALSAPVCLINNASTFVHDTPLEFHADIWDRQFDTNLRAPALLSAAFVKRLPPDAEACIINILDQNIAAPTPDFFSYTLTKSALAAMTRLHAIAFAPEVRVCGVAPGLTLPSDGQTQDQFEAAHNTTLLGRGSTTASVAAAVCYLVEAPHVTGQILYVDGGERFESGRHSSSDPNKAIE